MNAFEAIQEKRLVRVWFGEHPIGTFIGSPALAERHEAKMVCRFAGLMVTNEPVSRG